tara:strand:- start:4080 stop:4874 length:795 start_codon:yes stop_codon:yes gene_type:complete
MKMKNNINIVLTIAGSDSSGGAGIQADIKTITSLGGYAATVITSVTSQNTQGVQGILDIPTEEIISQFDSVETDLNIRVIKTGMINNTKIIREIVNRSKNIFLVVDPVMVASSGDVLVNNDVFKQIRSNLIPHATIVTPNIPEAEILADMKINSIEDQIKAGKKILKLGPKNVLVKGGHANTSSICDVLISDHQEKVFENPKIESKNTHGTGCTLASAIATFLGNDLGITKSVHKSIQYVRYLLEKSPDIGAGNGPLHHGLRND